MVFFAGPKPGDRQRSSSLPQARGDGIVCEFGHKRAIVFPPSRWVPPAKKEPLGAGLVRDHVYGVNGSIIGGLHLLRDGRVLYVAARLCIMEDLTDGRHTYFDAHDADVLSIGYCQARDIAVSGQQDPLGPACPCALVWSPRCPQRPLAQLRSFACLSAKSVAMAGRGDTELMGEVSLKMITAVAISCTGRVVALFADDEQKTICIYELPDALLDAQSAPEKPMVFKQPIYSCSTGRSRIDAAFVNPLDVGDPNRIRFVTIIEKQLSSNIMKFWDYRLGGRGEEQCMTTSNATFGKNASSALTWCAFCDDEGFYLASGNNGHLYILSGNSCMSSTHVTLGKVGLGCVAMLTESQEYEFVVAASDGELSLGRVGEDGPARPGGRRKLGNRAQIGAKFSLGKLPGADQLPKGMRPRWNNVLVLNQQTGLVLLGSENHLLVLVDLGLARGAQRRVVRVLQVGYNGECSALAHHPTMQGLCASGDSKGVVRFWDTVRKRPLANKTYKNDFPVYAMEFNASGDLLALAQGEGMLDVLFFPSLERAARKRISHEKDAEGKFERLCDVKFSTPEQDGGGYLACACWDQRIYLLRVTRTSRNKGIDAETDRTQVIPHKTLKGNSSSPTHLMFTADGHYVMSNSKDAQILIWKTCSGERMHSLSIARDARWPQWTCILGWPTIGCWQTDYDLTDLNAVCQTAAPAPNGSHYIAGGDDNHCIVLYRFPAHSTDCDFSLNFGHASHVTNVRFNSSNVLVSTGGNDHTLIQWRLVEEEPEVRKFGTLSAPPPPRTMPWTGVTASAPPAAQRGRPASAVPGGRGSTPAGRPASAGPGGRGIAAGGASAAARSRQGSAGSFAGARTAAGEDAQAVLDMLGTVLAPSPAQEEAPARRAAPYHGFLGPFEGGEFEVPGEQEEQELPSTSERLPPQQPQAFGQRGLPQPLPPPRQRQPSNDDYEEGGAEGGFGGQMRRQPSQDSFRQEQARAARPPSRDGRRPDQMPPSAAPPRPPPARGGGRGGSWQNESNAIKDAMMGWQEDDDGVPANGPPVGVSVSRRLGHGAPPRAPSAPAAPAAGIRRSAAQEDTTSMQRSALNDRSNTSAAAQQCRMLASQSRRSY